MLLAIDVQYSDDYATVAGVAFDPWQAATPNAEYTSWVEGIAEYEPGQFFKRELPCLLKLLENHALHPQCIIVDGFVFLDGAITAGLGKHLYDALDGVIAVIGVAKTPFKLLEPHYQVYRGQSQKPLWVTAVGIDLEQAKANILRMHGPYRLPTLLKRVDQLCRRSPVPINPSLPGPN